ncbi:hypothetical protein EIN_335550 [Entamoeba invadens IP1]|uniref:CCHC-type domain-containing protein n=1 Tax=Entamoeba invadens IP1 TaxID=370355 RepID=L7FLC9_ENTIV|nr:hypothetical protein EIN_335550 [Entamoeba invadens IP1]ELP88573.1 hypothetical protein EIN_335550 [Entamoeba invadens IP1]|eukprot:XP_004255344.1 hypothetical protein EIN_335550 [Entamoeba invadens IP1]
MLKPIELYISNISNATTVAEFEELFKGYNVKSVEVFLHKKDVVLNTGIVKAKSVEEAAKIYQEMSTGMSDGKHTTAEYSPEDKTQIIVSGFPQGTKEPRFVEYFRDFDIESANLIVEKKGTPSGKAKVVVKDRSDAVKIMMDIRGKVFKGKALAVCGNLPNPKDYEKAKLKRKCFICGNYGHSKDECPQRNQDEVLDPNADSQESEEQKSLEKVEKQSEEQKPTSPEKPKSVEKEKKTVGKKVNKQMKTNTNKKVNGKPKGEKRNNKFAKGNKAKQNNKRQSRD